MKTCAMGAMLFGGTLGASAQAATVTLIDNFTTGFGPGTTAQSGAGILGRRIVDNTGTPLSFQNPGFKWSGNAYNNGTVEYSDFGTLGGSLDLTNTVLTMTGSGGGTGTANLMVTLFNSNQRSAIWNVAFSNSMTMSTSAFTHTDAGFNLSQVTAIQVMTADNEQTSTVNYTMTNFSYSAVPAPGALALLGVSGLVAARRRRA
jgi:hypothetical protein